MKEKIECPICGKMLSRINLSHIRSHGLTVEEFEIKFPLTKRTEGQLNKSKRFADKIIGKDFVVCPICNQKILEINNTHLWKHGLTIDVFDQMFPDFKRLSDVSIKNKNTLGNGKLTEDISKRLKFGHTKDSYILKYGKVGREKYDEVIKKYSLSKRLDGYILKYGIEEGTKRYKEKNKRISYSASLERYISKFGETKGPELYLQRCLKGKQNISPDERDNFTFYTKVVRTITNISIKKYSLDPKKERSMKNHIDHMYSIYDGFKNKISPVYIGSHYNLRLVPSSINCKKQKKSILDISVLIEKVDNDGFYINLMTSYEKKLKELQDGNRERINLYRSANNG